MTDPRFAAYVARHGEAVKRVLSEPYPTDAPYAPFFRRTTQEKTMTDEALDPLTANAAAVYERANALRPADVLMDRPKDAVATVPNPIKLHERDEAGRTTRLVLGR